MKWIVPKIARTEFLRISAITALGCLIAGLYGGLHDQITYTLSPEYFTRFKFFEFQFADFRLPARGFVFTIGALATWWVGGISGWLLSRIAVPATPFPIALRECMAGFGLILASSILAALVGNGVGILHSNQIPPEQYSDMGVHAPGDFFRVACIHNAGYLGGLTGLIAALLLVRLRR